MLIGIRREDKSRFEARVPLTPEDVGELIGAHGLAFRVQSSPIRAFPEDAYQRAGAAVVDSLADCPVIMGVKEIPVAKLEPGKTYVYFSHTIKGQRQNMPALRRLLELGCQLIDYERIVDEAGRRLVFFGRYAGLAGMIDTFWALGRRMKVEGIATPFERVEPAHHYRDLAHARRELTRLAEAIRRDGLPPALRPFVCGFAGYGQVSKGAQEIFDLLPTREVAPADLVRIEPAANACYKVVFREEHMVRRVDASAPFELREYYDHPERYAASFFQYAPLLTLLVNCIYWDSKYPKLVDEEQFRELFAGSTPPRLRVVGDITCDVDGSLACTTRATDPGNPIYVYDPQTRETRDGVEGRGPVVLAVDLLPCELPVDASRHFSQSLRPFVPALARADFGAADVSRCGLPPELERATIVYRGQLTERYRYLAEHVNVAP